MKKVAKNNNRKIHVCVCVFIKIIRKSKKNLIQCLLRDRKSP